MGRRDTIIVAVLVNAGLLMVLFATATKSKPTAAIMAQTIVKQAPEVKKAPLQAQPQPIAAATTLDELLFASEDAFMVESIIEEETVAAQSVESSSDFLTITVKQGDALEKIARANHTTIAEIVAVNGLQSTKLQLGQKIKIPFKNNAPVVSSPITTSKPIQPEEYYTVKDGDNPWLIASKSHVKLEELLKLNNLNATTAKKLRPGDRLRIR